jgi:cytochrome P450
MITHKNPKQKRQRAPGPCSRQLFRSLLEVRSDRLKFVRRAINEYGDVVGFRMGFKRLYLLNHPDYIKYVLHDNPQNYQKGLGLVEAKPLLGEGLLTSEGEVWASQRRMLQRIFRRERHHDFSIAMTDVISSMLKRWTVHAETGQALNVTREMARVTLGILGATLFRTDFDAMADEVAANLTLLTRWAMRRMTALLHIPLSVPTPRNLRARQALYQLDSVAQGMVREHREKGFGFGEDDNLLTQLILMEHKKPGAGITEKHLRDQIMTFLLAGHETTAVTLAWTWYLLAQHPNVEKQLYEELERVLVGRKPILADLPRLVYTKLVVEEVMRLYPPVWIIPRRAIADDEIGGYTIPAHSDVLLSVYSLHRHSAFWEAPENFNPERFTPEKSAQRHPYAYLPFGAGPRSCLGNGFGMMELLLVVAMVAQRYRLELLSSDPVEAEALLTLRPVRSIRIRLRERKQFSPN